jgi:vitamin B12 transporter
MKNTLILLICMSFPGLIHSQSQEDIKLENVVVTGSRLPLDMKKTGRNISILTSEEISKIPASSLDELMRYIPGVETQSRGGFGVQSDIIIRGSTFQQVLILIDGMRVNDPLTGHFNSYIPISPAEIDRIEVLRGPAAVLFGADAVGGVIHIITKSFGRVQDIRKDALMSLSYGENNFVSGKAGAYLSKEKYQFALGALINQSDGHLLASGGRGDFSTLTLSGSGGYRINDQWKVMGRLGYDNRDFNAQYFYTRSPLDQSRETTSALWTQMKLRNDQGESYTDFDVSFKRATDVFVFSPDFPSTNEHATHYINFQVNHFSTLSDTWSLAYGLQTDQRQIESSDRGDHEDVHIGAYSVLNFYKHNLNVNSSLRVDYDQNYDLEWTPQLSSSYSVGKWILRGAIGRSIRAADYTERYISTKIENLSPGRNLGNPDLQAESAWTYEAGVDFYPLSGIRFTGTTFVRDASSLIDFVVTNERDITNNNNLELDQDYFWTQNLSDISTRGYELEAWHQRSITNQLKLNFVLGYVYLNTSNPDGGEISKYIANHARHMVTHQTILEIDSWSLSVNALFKQRDDEKAEAINSELLQRYMVWNSRLTYEMKAGIGFHLEARNLFDVQYSDILGAKMPGRWILGGISWRLKD